MEMNEPATKDSIDVTESQLGMKFPEDFIELMLQSNGCEGLIGDNRYLSIWRMENIASLNKAYQVEEFAPGLVLFGSDGGDEGYAFDTKQENMPIVMVPFIGMLRADTVIMGANFIEFLKSLSQ